MSTLAADRARLVDLEAQIVLLEHSPLESRSQNQFSLSELHSQKHLVLERLDSYKYPVLTLPNEITIEIFMHFLPTYPLCPPLIGLLSPTFLTQICRGWREIALGTAALWRAISLNDHRIPFERQAHLCNLWLSRSRSYPLSVDYNNALIEAQATEILSTLVPQRARWEHIGLRFSISSLPIIEGPMPLLRNLNLYLVNFDLITAKVSSLDAPLLRTVVLNDNAAGHLTLPWAQLTALTLPGFFPRECVAILQHASNLVHCELKLFDDGVDVPDISLPSLQSLTVTGDAGPGFLETLIAPTLRDLRVSESLLEPECIETLAAFISKSCCQLQKLCVEDVAIESMDSYRDAFPLITVSFDS
ncbi:hypothetical protein B0H14DRAFT_628418 [Mycena olivaceomarginata]|nr:hypothetical protein B0H14DRAFT_628418 [Mycena olivaceomarginata]